MLSVPENVKVAEVLLVGFAGEESMKVSGGTLSKMKVTVLSVLV